MKKRWHEVIPELDGQKIGCRSNQIVNTSVASNRLAEGVSDSSCPPGVEALPQREGMLKMEGSYLRQLTRRK